MSPASPAATTLRDYGPEDLPAVLDLLGSILAAYGFGPDLGGVRQDLEAAPERYSGPRAGIWVAERRGVVVGTVAIRVKDAATAELKRLYVDPVARGAGLGQALYAHAEAFARAAGYGKLWLDSSRRFVEARRLYERNGFALVEELDNDWEDNVYEKTLTAG